MAIQSTFRLYILGHLQKAGLESIEERLRTYVKGNSTTLKVMAETHVACQLPDSATKQRWLQELTMLATFRDAQAVATVQLDPSQESRLSQNILNLRAYCETGYPPFNSQALRDLGGQLFEMILQDSVRSLFEKATAHSRRLLPFEIVVQDHRIAGWPWEYLFDPYHQKFISQEFHPVSRVIFNADPSKARPQNRDSIRVLIVIGVLLDDKVAPPESQIKSIEERLYAHVAKDSITVKIIAETTPEAVIRELDPANYDIVHFYGHAGFDIKQAEGYLLFEQQDGEPRKWYANQVAHALQGTGVRLAFLNACKTAAGDPSAAPSRSSVAAALLDRDIPAVIATQFEMPIASADLFASLTYNALASGKPVIEAMSRGRQAMDLGHEKRFMDWGIPVLYASNPKAVIFPRPKDKQPKAWERGFEGDLSNKGILETLRSPKTEGGPTLAVERTVRSQEKQHSKVKVAIVDLNARVGFLPELVEAANHSQRYYGFEVDLLPLPAGSIGIGFMEEGGACQLLLHHLESYLQHAARKLNVEHVCYITSCMIAGEENGEPFFNRFGALLGSSGDVSAITTYNFAKYAREVNVSFAKATLYLCLAMLIATDQGGQVAFHDEIVGCPLDNWQSRDDFLTGLGMMSFNHSSCREKIKNQEQLEAIDQLLALQMDWSL